MFILVPDKPGSPGSKAVKRLCVCSVGYIDTLTYYFCLLLLLITLLGSRALPAACL